METENKVSPIKTGLTFWDGKYVGEIDKYINTNQIDKTFSILTSSNSLLTPSVNSTNSTSSATSLLKVKLISRKSFTPLILEQIKKQFKLYPIEILQCKMSNEDFYMFQDKKGLFDNKANNPLEVSLLEYISKLKQNNKKLSSNFLNDLRKVLVFKYILGFRKNLAKDIMIRYLKIDGYKNEDSPIDYIYPLYFPENIDELENMPQNQSFNLDSIKSEITLYFGNNNETFITCLCNLCKEINIDELEKTIHDVTKKYNATFLLKWLVEVINFVGENSES